MRAATSKNEHGTFGIEIIVFCAGDMFETCTMPHIEIEISIEKTDDFFEGRDSANYSSPAIKFLFDVVKGLFCWWKIIFCVDQILTLIDIKMKSACLVINEILNWRYPISCFVLKHWMNSFHGKWQIFVMKVKQKIFMVDLLFEYILMFNVYSSIIYFCFNCLFLSKFVSLNECFQMRRALFLFCHDKLGKRGMYSSYFRDWMQIDDLFDIEIDYANITGGNYFAKFAIKAFSFVVVGCCVELFWA